ncbi:MAG: nucleotide exchange factor GrpE [Clostridiales bacterium]|nr:nucleotide exchange factor GrpE [Clostridiales bacterium]
MSKEKCKCGCGQDFDDELDEKDFYENNKNSCGCSGDCDCGDDCKCTEEDKCNPDCICGEECSCDDDCNCGKTKVNEINKDYLQDLLRVQAEFDNYRKRMMTALGDARTDGFIDAIEGFLPALDSFKMATDMITDKNTLMGIKFIEKGIYDTLSKMGVELIDTSKEFDPNFHQAVDTDSTSDAETNVITKVIANGFTYKGKVIRYAQVVVKR